MRLREAYAASTYVVTVSESSSDSSSEEEEEEEEEDVITRIRFYQARQVRPKDPEPRRPAKRPKTTFVYRPSISECVICLESFKENETLRSMHGCGHVMHDKCLEGREVSECPICREEQEEETAV